MKLKRRVLLVDDDREVLASLGTVLTHAGYEVIQASDGAEGIRIWRQLNGGDLAIINLFMPGKDAVDTIAELRAYNPGLPIIVISAGEGTRQEALLTEAKLSGVVATLEKPFNPHALLALVART